MEKFGYKREQVNILRTAHLWYPEEPLFREIPIQVKYNRARVGDLKVGDKIQNLRLVDLSTNKMANLVNVKEERRLFGLLSPKRSKQAGKGTTVILAGSYS